MFYDILDPKNQIFRFDELSNNPWLTNIFFVPSEQEFPHMNHKSRNYIFLKILSEKEIYQLGHEFVVNNTYIRGKYNVYLKDYLIVKIKGGILNTIRVFRSNK